MSQSRIPSTIIRNRQYLKETTHKIIDNTSAPKVGLWPDLNNPINELDRDFRFGLPGNGGHECLQASKPEEKYTMAEFLKACNEVQTQHNLELDNDMKMKFEGANLKEDLPGRVYDAMWEASKHTEREDEIMNELNEYFGLKEAEDKNADYERRVQEVTSLQKMMVNDKMHFAISDAEMPELKKELGLLFGETDMSGKTKVDVQSVITISFKTENNMASWSDEVADERDQKLAEFYKTANNFVKLLEGFGEWADYIDPVEGKPWLGKRTETMVEQTSKNFNEISCLSVEDYGCCEMLSHEKFGTNVYVGTIVTSMEASNLLFTLLKKGPDSRVAGKLAGWSLPSMEE